ncbi:MAG TPA: glycosyltransferase family 4 protein [Chthoniobacterales bacterium]|nr:glycosyltransferase family 4 protein [Chthoniobacterales bacterium]
MILLSHPTGNEFVREALVAFDRAGTLGEFWTTVSWDSNSLIDRALPPRLGEILRRRSFVKTVQSRTHTVPLREMIRLFAGAIGITSRHETGAFSIDAVLRALDRKVAERLRKIDNPEIIGARESFRSCNTIYAYEDGALQSFRAARDLGLKRIYDLPIGYWRVGQRIFAEEKEREPAWAATLTGTLDSAEKLGRKDDELRLATRVIVASTFTKQTLADAPSTAKIDIVAYGAPPTISDEIRKSNGRLKVLFAGSLGQRKGLSYLLKAVEMLKDAAELTLLGRKAASGCAPLENAVRKYRWVPTLSHAGMLREMQSHDVLVLPSLFEGFGLVILEAMAQGTVVITTDHTAGPDVIENGTDGFIVPIRSAEAIAEKLDLLASDRERLMAMKLMAKQKAASRGWETYRQRLVEVAREVMAS